MIEKFQIIFLIIGLFFYLLSFLCIDKNSFVFLLLLIVAQSFCLVSWGLFLLKRHDKDDING